MSESVEQAVRRSHCAHDERDRPDHRCVGTCTITPRGVTLDCKLCGADFLPVHPFDRAANERARAILSVAGVDWRSLSDDAQAAVVREIRRSMCPGCGTEKPPGARYYSCHCGAYSHYEDSTGWRRHPDSTPPEAP